MKNSSILILISLTLSINIQSYAQVGEIFEIDDGRDFNSLRLEDDFTRELYPSNSGAVGIEEFQLKRTTSLSTPVFQQLRDIAEFQERKYPKNPITCSKSDKRSDIVICSGVEYQKIVKSKPTRITEPVNTNNSGRFNNTKTPVYKNPEYIKESSSFVIEETR